MRLVPLLLVALLLAACGSSVEETGVPASSGRDSETASGSGTASGPTEPASDPVEDSKLKPPPILLVSEFGKQKAVRGSYCVDYVDVATGQGSGVCSDSSGPTYPDAVTSVLGGASVTFVVADAVVKDGSVTVRPMGCTDEKIAELPFESGSRELRWDVDLEHGAYQLDVFAVFEADDGRTGDVSGSLGLTVAGPKKWDAVAADNRITSDMQVCPFEG